MSESAYKSEEGGSDPPPPSDSGTSRVTVGIGFAIDTTYPRSIEGILKIITVVSQPFFSF